MMDKEAPSLNASDVEVSQPITGIVCTAKRNDAIAMQKTKKDIIRLANDQYKSIEAMGSMVKKSQPRMTRKSIILILVVNMDLLCSPPVVQLMAPYVLPAVWSR